MFLGYNTNGFAHHKLSEAVELLAEIGYRGVAITIDHGALAPYEKNIAEQLAGLRQLLERLEMRSVIETGARFLLDSREKHEPTLLSPDPRRRIDFYKHAVDCAAELKSDCVSIWSGAMKTPLSEQQAWRQLLDGLLETLEYASERGVSIAFEPEPGMFVDSTRGFRDLTEKIDADARFDKKELRLTLDIGHLHCQGETPIAAAIGRHAAELANVHIEDMRAGKHEHLMFGDGEIDFPPVLQALTDVGYSGGVYVELSRHSHEAPAAARKAFDFLQRLY